MCTDIAPKTTVLLKDTSHDIIFQTQLIFTLALFFFLSCWVTSYLDSWVCLTRKSPEGGGLRGGTQTFLGGYVLCGFPKVGSRKQVFFEKWGVLGAKIQKFATWELKFGPKTRLKMHFFLKFENGGGHIDGKLVG